MIIIHRNSHNVNPKIVKLSLICTSNTRGSQKTKGMSHKENKASCVTAPFCYLSLPRYIVKFPCTGFL